MSTKITVPCDECDGEGYFPVSGGALSTCPVCSGNGFINDDSDADDYQVLQVAAAQRAEQINDEGYDQQVAFLEAFGYTESEISTRTEGHNAALMDELVYETAEALASEAFSEGRLTVDELWATFPTH